MRLAFRASIIRLALSVTLALFAPRVTEAGPIIDLLSVTYNVYATGIELQFVEGPNG